MESLATLYTMALMSEGDILEVGSWCGKSAMALALGAKQRGAKVYCVDVWPDESDWIKTESGYKMISGGLTNFNECPIYQNVFEEKFLPIYRMGGPFRIFKESCKEFGVSKVVQPIRGTSEELPKTLTVGLVHIDADHTKGAVIKDIESSRKCLSPGGWIVFDDYVGWPGVKEAIDQSNFSMGSQITSRLYAAR
jgi:predicted O-methyltransferase YrrM